MYSFKELGYASIWFVGSIRIFFRFLGHFFSSFFHCISGNRALSKKTLLKTIFYSGVRLAIPVMIISFLIGISLSLSLYNIFNEMHLSNKALPVAQKIIIHTLAPFLIAVILIIQSALNLINANIHKLHHTPDEVMCEYIIPIAISLFTNGLLLYIYALFTFLVTIYSTFQFIINIDIRNILWHLASYIPLFSLLYSIFKVMIFCCIINLVVGYYYYEISIREVSLRKAVSRIMTRSLFFIIFFGVYLNIFYE